MVDDVLRKRSCVFCGAMLREFASAGGKQTWSCPDCGMVGVCDGRGNLNVTLLPSCPKCDKVWSIVVKDFITLRVGCVECGCGIMDETGSVSSERVERDLELPLGGV